MTDTGALKESLAAAVAHGVPGIVAGLTDVDGPTYVGAAGVRSLATGEPAASDTVVNLFSVTKAFTATAALQCVDDGLIDLDAPARNHLPEIGDLRVLVSLDEDGTLTTRPPRRDITPRMLLVHTAGLAYDVFDPTYARLARARTGEETSWDTLRMPLLHDPGDRWTYGIGTDWLGALVARVRGERLEHVFRERIYEPCGMTSTSFDLTPEMAGRAATVHRRQRSGGDRAGPGARAVGVDVRHGRTRALVDGARCARPAARLAGRRLRARRPGAAPRDDRVGRGASPGGGGHRTRSGDPRTHTPPALVPRAADLVGALVPARRRGCPRRRREGSLSWVGLGNVHYWIDRASGLAGVWAAQLLPLEDGTCVSGFEDFEKSAYALPPG